MSELMRDLRFTGRSLRKYPGFALVVILTLALGIGANSAIFSVVDGVLFRPFPYHDGNRLVRVFENDRLRGTTQEGFSGPDYFDLVERQRSFSELAMFQSLPYALTSEGGEPAQIVGTRTTPSLLPVLGTMPLLGRGFTEEEATPGGPAVVMLSYSMWRDRFGARTDIVGRTITLDGVSREIVGVMPEGFTFPGPQTAFWLPFQVTATTLPRGNHGLSIVARLRDEVSLDQANDDVTAIAAQLEGEYPDENLGRGMWGQGLLESVVGNVRTPLLVLLGAVGFVLLIACVNVASLLFARAAVREREIAIRVTMGAGRGRLVRQLLTESLVFAVLGGVAGLGLGALGIEVLQSLGPADLPRLAEVGIDGRVLLFTGAIVAFTATMFGVMPSLQASRADLLSPLKEGGRAGSSQGRHRLRRGLVVAEVGLAMMLVMGAGLLIRSFWRLTQVDPGFEAENVVTASMQLPASRYPQVFPDWPDWPEVRNFQTELVARVEALPDVASAAITLNTPLNAGWTTRYHIEGRPEVPEGEMDEVRIRVVSPRYFRTVGMHVVAGRDFTDFDDRTDAPPVLMINEAFARRHFEPSENPLQQRIRIWSQSREIVGVVEDVKFNGLTQETPPAVYPTFSQMPFAGFALVARTRGNPQTLLAQIRDQVWAIDGDIPLTSVSTLEAVVDAAVAQPRFQMLLLTLFAAVALILAAVGIYGVMSYAVTQRLHEIGVRLSLGARTGDVLRDVVGEGVLLAGAGGVAGLLGAAFLSKVLASLLFEIGRFDLVTLLGTAATCVLVAVAASFVPAWRASRVDPMIALRYE